MADTDGFRIPDEIDNSTISSWNLGTGAAGRSLFLLELHKATGNDSFRRAGLREMAYALDRVAGLEGSDVPFGLFNGIAGLLFATTEWHRITGAVRFRDAATQLRQRLAIPVSDDDIDGTPWGPADDILVGSAGIGLSLLHTARTLEDTAALRLARATGTALLHRARRVDEGWWWSRAAGGDLNLPNFSHGTAGVGFFLARLFVVTGDSTFLEGAERAAAYLIHVADRSDGLFLVPYGIPNDGYVTAYDIGWAHGPAGTASLFVSLTDITGHATYREIVQANVRTLAATGMPEPTADARRWTGPFKIDRRFGTSGAAVFLLRFTRQQSNPPSPLARRLIEDILARADRDDRGLWWSLPRYGFQGDEGTPSTFTGFFYGAAGLGLALLEMHHAENGDAPIIEWPDDPFRSRVPGS